MTCEQYTISITYRHSRRTRYFKSIRTPNHQGRCPPIGKWSLTSLQQRLVKTGGRLIKHARYYWLLLAESHLTRRLFGSMLRRIAMLPSPAG